MGYTAELGRVAWALFPIILMGCAGNPIKNWGKNMDQLGIVAVYPPRNDIRAGYVYVEPNCLNEKNKVFRKVLLADLESFNDLGGKSVSSLLKQTNSHYPVFQKQTASMAQSDSASSYVSLVPGSASFIADTKGVPVLKQVAFPALELARASGGDINAILSAYGVPIPASASFGSTDTASISVNRAVSYSLPAADLMKMLKSKESELLSEPLYAAMQRKSPFCQEGVIITLITEVYYAWNFDISLNSSAAGALKLSLASLSRQPSDGVTAIGTLPLPQTASEVISMPQAASSTLGNMDAQHREVVISTLRKNYEQPVAIGYRGISYILTQAGGANATHKGLDPSPAFMQRRLE